MTTGTASNTITFDGGGTLDISTPAATFTVTSNIGGAGGLTKLGIGTLALTGANAYTGDTRVFSGTLNISQAYLNNLADVYLSPGISFGLNYSGIDEIDSLFINGAPQAVGTYGAIGSSCRLPNGAIHWPGLLRVTSVGLPGDYNGDGAVNAADYVVWRKSDGSQTGFQLWRANFGNSLGTGANTLPSPTVTIYPAIPEPASALLSIMGWGAAVTIRRRRWFATQVPSTRHTKSESLECRRQCPE